MDDQRKNDRAISLIKKAAYILIQCTWGGLQTVAGFVVFLLNIKRTHTCFHGAIVTEWKYGSSVSLGLFIFVSPEGRRSVAGYPSDEWHQRLIVHEYGHSVQSLFLGPLYLLVIGLPSLIWCGLPVLERRRQKKRISYYSFYPERLANYCGEKVTKQKSTEQSIID